MSFISLTEWKQAFSLTSFRRSFATTLPAFIAIVVSLPFCFTYFEQRDGFVMWDPVLEHFDPVNVSGFTFFFTYLAGFSGMLYLFSSPSTALRGMQAYVIMMSMRLICLFLIPLDPPVTIIPLQDVILETFFYSGQAYQKDLFFSGHTATIFLFALIARNKYWKYFFYLSSALIGFGVLIQHVHYTIDVLAAPVAAWLAWRISKWTYKLSGEEWEVAASGSKL